MPWCGTMHDEFAGAIPRERPLSWCVTMNMAFPYERRNILQILHRVVFVPSFCSIIAIILFCTSCILNIDFYDQFVNNTAYAAPFTPSDSVIGNPDISPSFINHVLALAHSPARGLGQEIYRDGAKSHIKPSFALAVFHMESSYGLRGVARYTHSIGNIRRGNNGYRSYRSWQEGVRDFYHLIKTVYIAHGLTTVRQIIPIYAPAADHNNPGQYVQMVRRDMALWSKRRV